MRFANGKTMMQTDSLSVISYISRLHEEMDCTKSQCYCGQLLVWLCQGRAVSYFKFGQVTGDARGLP